jgi:hypothetical protein
LRQKRGVRQRVQLAADGGKVMLRLGIPIINPQRGKDVVRNPLHLVAVEHCATTGE